jgi:tetratricopeptide (TPR) repeat protein
VSFVIMLTLFLFGTAGMILFLNFSDREVRDRDYFFTTGYHAYAIWMGLGLVWLVGWVRESFPAGAQRRAATVAAAVLLAAQPFVILRNLWFVQDGSRNYVAHDYAWNMLAPLAPNSFVFTNGDNDTFPLWYLQQVEEFRQDVKVVNLSLLNTDWYIFQLRDEEPKVPVNLPDAVIRALGGGAFEDTAGRIIYTNEFMVRHILEQDRRGAGWIKQPYFAVTVPENYGFGPYFTFEGMVERVNRDTLGIQVDEPKARYNLYRRFKYRGLFNPDGSWDSTVYKDENAATLTRNYAAAHLRLAFYHRARGELDAAIAEMERVQRMFPSYVDVLVPLGGFYLERGDTGRASAFFRELVQRQPGNAELHYFYGVTLAYQRDLPGALRELDATIRLDPGYPRTYYLAYQLLEQSGQHERALEYLRQLVAANPEDERARRILQLTQPQPQSPLPPPPRP